MSTRRLLGEEVKLLLVGEDPTTIAADNIVGQAVRAAAGGGTSFELARVDFTLCVTSFYCTVFIRYNRTACWVNPKGKKSAHVLFTTGNEVVLCV